jgi:F420-non-reducing hydrogenase iron-sulfur subunit
VIVFLCANCAEDVTKTPVGLPCPSRPVFPWTCAVDEVVVPCAGRLQPEHILRAFEAGADLVCVVACEEDNCHFLEGSCRAERRIKYIHQLLEDIGMDARHLMMLHLPGSAFQEMSLGSLKSITSVATSVPRDELSRQILAVAAQVTERLNSLPPSPLHKPRKADDEFAIAAIDAEEENDE